MVNGHHRYALAKNSGVSSVNAIVDREADGVTAEQAHRNGILINIRDEQGDVRDYAEFVRNEKMDEGTAEKEGILARKKGRQGYFIGHFAGDDLYAAYRNGDISDGKAAAIAEVSQGDKGLDAAGLRLAKNRNVEELRQSLKMLKNTPRSSTETGDLFGFDDSAIQTAEKVGSLAAKHIHEGREKVRAAQNAIKNPDAARKLGVKVGRDAEKLLEKARQELYGWEHYDQDPALYHQLLQEAGIEAPQSGAVMNEERGERKEESARQSREASGWIKASNGTNGTDGTNGTGPVEEAAEAGPVKEERRSDVSDKAAQKTPKAEQRDGTNETNQSDLFDQSDKSDVSAKDLYAKIRKAKEGSAERIMAFVDLPDGEHELGGIRFSKKGNAFERDGQQLSARGIEKSFRGVDIAEKKNATPEKQKQTAHPVPVNYKKWDGDNWSLSKPLGELIPEFMAALDDGHKLYTDTAKGIYHLEKAADGKYKETLPSGEERIVSRGTMEMFIDRRLISDNPKIELKEELPDYSNKRRSQKDGSDRLYSRKRTDETDGTRAYYQIPFAESVESVINGTHTGRGMIFVRETPEALRSIGIPALPVMMTQQHIRDIYNDTAPDKRNAHDLGEQLKHLPEMLEHPVAVIASSQNDRVIVITQYRDKAGNDIMVPVIIGAEASVDGNCTITANIAASAYGKKSVRQMLENAIEAENRGEVAIFGANTKTASKLMPGKHQLLSQHGFHAVHNIDDVNSPVKGVFKKQTETLQLVN